MKRARHDPEAPSSAQPFLPSVRTLPTLRAAAAGCRGCDLYQRGTQTVFGAGPTDAQAVLVGEQPGNEEDLSGAPFVGPAGRLLDRALVAAGIDRERVYVTNAVKHFKWVARGKRRIHERPNAREVAACRPWLMAELELIRPRVLVCLGATATQALLGPRFRLSHARGQALTGTDLAPIVLATVHPSAVLRAPEEHRQEELAAFLDDLRVLAALLREPAQPTL